jgi:hypothetical protein
MVGTSPTMTMKRRETPHPNPLPQGERGHGAVPFSQRKTTLTTS